MRKILKDSRRSITAGGLVLLLTIMNRGISQEVQSPGDIFSANQAQQSGIQSLSREQILYYLVNEKVAAAGVGFSNAQIGDPVDSIIKIWGEPDEKNSDWVLGGYEVVYRPGAGLSIAFTGNQSIKSIAVEGASDAMFRTARGARFGMPAQMVLRLYAYEPVKIKENRASFKDLGIDFYFSNDQLHKIKIYRPKSGYSIKL